MGYGRLLLGDGSYLLLRGYCKEKLSIDGEEATR